MGQQGFLINTEDCIGCKACELACKDLHSFDIGPRTRRVYEVCGGDWSVDDVTGVCVPSNVFACAGLSHVATVTTRLACRSALQELMPKIRKQGWSLLTPRFA